MKRVVSLLCSRGPSAAALQSLDVPELLVLDSPVPCVASLQSYTTVHGPALSAMFDRDPSVFPFQRQAFALGGAPMCYVHALMDSLFDYAETPRTQRGARDVDVLAPPMASLSQQCGTLNTIYYTLHVPPAHPSEQSSLAAAPLRSVQHARTVSPLVLPHPTYGSVEPARSERRGGRVAMDLRSSLFDERSRSISTVVVTGADSEENSPAPRLVLRDDEEHGTTATLERILHRKVLLLNQLTSASESTVLQTTNTPSSGVLRSALVPLRGGCFGMALQVPAPVSDSPRSSESAERSLVVAPWVVLRMALVFGAAVAEAISFPAATTSHSTASGGATTPSWNWCLAAYHATQSADLDATLPVEVVAAPPKPFASYTMPPWKHRIGLPTLCGAPCMALHVELRQSGRVAGSGVYYLTPVAAP